MFSWFSLQVFPFLSLVSSFLLYSSFPFFPAPLILSCTLLSEVNYIDQLELSLIKSNLKVYINYKLRFNIAELARKQTNGLKEERISS